MDLAELHEKGIAHSQFTIVVLSIQQTVIVVSRVDQLLSSNYTKPTKIEVNCRVTGKKERKHSPLILNLCC